jgi:hypothetical protein
LMGLSVGEREIGDRRLLSGHCRVVIRSRRANGPVDPLREVSFEGCCEVEGWDAEKRPAGYEAAKTAISNALRRGAVTGKLIPIYEYVTNCLWCKLHY